MILGDTHYGKVRDYLELSTTDDQDRACCFLEGHGLVFCTDFGIANAIEKANMLRIQIARQRERNKPEMVTS